MIHLQICGVTDFQANPFVDVGSQFFVGFEAILWDFLGIWWGYAWVYWERAWFLSLGFFNGKNGHFFAMTWCLSADFPLKQCRYWQTWETTVALPKKKTAHAKMYQIQLARGGVFGNMDITLIHSPWQSYNGRINLRCILSTPCPPTPRKYG